MNKHPNRRTVLTALGTSTAIVGVMAASATPAMAEDRDLFDKLLKRYLDFLNGLGPKYDPDKPTPIGSIGIRG